MYLVNIQVENKFLSELRLDIPKYIENPEYFEILEHCQKCQNCQKLKIVKIVKIGKSAT